MQNTSHRSDLIILSPKKWRWYHGVLFYVGVQVASLTLGKAVQSVSVSGNPKLGESFTGNADNDAFYNSLKQPTFAPPDWVFPPVWIVNNALCVWGLLRVLNMPTQKPGRTPFVISQSLVWLCFTTFNASYFGLRSPINGAVNTNIGLICTIISVYVALFQLQDTPATLSQSTILPWLLLASPTATAVAIWNKDEYYNVEPLMDPPSKWVK